MDIASSVCDLGFTCWDRSNNCRSYIWELEEKFKKLDDIKCTLDSLFKDVKRRVYDEEEHSLIRTDQVRTWLNLAERNITEVEDDLAKGRLVAENKCLFGYCPNYWPSRLKYGKIVDGKLANLKETLNQGHNLLGQSQLTFKPDGAVMLKFPLDTPVGVDSTFKNIWSHVEDENVRSIGLFGMGGVGKTMLLKMIHNNFLRVNHGYNLVVWIDVSQQEKPQDVAKMIQRSLWKELDLGDEEWEGSSEHSRGAKILDILENKKKFLMFLDGMWERIDLLGLGVPWQNQIKRSKVIFTTRIEDVCTGMQADKQVKVDCLPPKEALELFHMYVLEETLDGHRQIPELARVVAGECRGLPLALVSMGRYMRGRSYIDQWRETVQVMRSCPADIPTMRKDVLPVLKNSYDKLSDETHRKCLLYCSLFPDDHEIPIHSLIDLWIAEGFLERHDDIYEARAYCLNTIIRELTSSCVLELVSHPSKGRRFVKLHGVIRRMALWIASKEGMKKNNYLVQENVKSFEQWELERWKSAKRVSVWHVNEPLKVFPSKMCCSNLSTLILRETCGQVFPDNLFSSLPCLKVLDLSGNRFLNALPGSIGQLSQLRFLSVQGTFIRRLPTTLKNLIKLVFLLVSYKCAPKTVLPDLPSLRVFRMIQDPPRTSSVYLPVPKLLKQKMLEMETLEVLENITGIREISLQLRSPESLKQLQSFPELCGRLRHLKIRNCNISITSLQPTMEHLRSLELDFVEFQQEKDQDIKDRDNKNKNKEQDLDPNKDDEEENEDKDGDDSDDEDKDKDGDGVEMNKVDEITVVPPELVTNNYYFDKLTHLEIANQVGGVDLKLVSLCAPTLEFLSIRCCESVREVISMEDIEDIDPDRLFPFLTYLKLELLPKLMRICKRKLAFPSLRCLEVTYCENLRQLPFDARMTSSSLLEIRGPQLWWNGLQWEGEDDLATKQLLSHKFIPSSI